jgi:hypothetical protein
VTHGKAVPRIIPAGATEEADNEHSPACALDSIFLAGYDVHIGEHPRQELHLLVGKLTRTKTLRLS